RSAVSGRPARTGPGTGALACGSGWGAGWGSCSWGAPGGSVLRGPGGGVDAPAVDRKVDRGFAGPELRPHAVHPGGAVLAHAGDGGEVEFGGDQPGVRPAASAMTSPS